jgi:hypothetical protein
MTTDPTGADPRMAAAINLEALAADLGAAGWLPIGDEDCPHFALKWRDIDVQDYDRIVVSESGQEGILLTDPIWQDALAIIARHLADAAANGGE